MPHGKLHLDRRLVHALRIGRLQHDLAAWAIALIAVGGDAAADLGELRALVLRGVAGAPESRAGSAQ